MQMKWLESALVWWKPASQPYWGFCGRRVVEEPWGLLLDTSASGVLSRNYFGRQTTSPTVIYMRHMNVCCSGLNGKMVEFRGLGDGSLSIASMTFAQSTLWTLSYYILHWRCPLEFDEAVLFQRHCAQFFRLSISVSLCTSFWQINCYTSAG